MAIAAARPPEQAPTIHAVECRVHSPVPDDGGGFECELPLTHDGDHRVILEWHG